MKIIDSKNRRLLNALSVFAFKCTVFRFNYVTICTKKLCVD